ncbi:chemotaxis protein CheW [Nocardioides sp. Root190]|uniref:chemotaxis protein CheW n=1 Tax=Nocardioides sp. Root190 TaxID=1736488 RepID=UPI0006F1F55E|nr:chemotaxis protein CheW [Nocardioides sp. Root190]KRB77920.1 chemotaxis protein CheW [Nocardioides sp. Root190]
MSTSASTVASTRTAEQYCTFWVADLYFGVAVDEVQEVLRHQPMTPVPRADEAVTGLINLRGQIVTAVDLRKRLRLPARPEGQVPMNVIVRSRGEVVSLLVDDIGDVIDTAGVDAQPAPSNMPRDVQDVVREVRPLPDAILLVLDADRAVDVATTPYNTGGTP